MAPSTQGRSSVRFGQFEVDLSRQQLLHRGIRVRLENHPFQVLAALLQRPGEIVTREELRRCLWPNGTYVDFEEGLNTAVKKLRQALQDSADNPRFVETIPRRGYRFIAPADIPTPVSEVANGPDVNKVIALSEPVAPKLYFAAWVILPTILIVMAGGFFLLRHRRSSWHAPALRTLLSTKLTDSGKVEDLAISPDGRYLAYLHGDSRGWDQIDGWEGGKSSLRLRQVATRSEVQILVKDADLYPGLTFSPDGNYIYFLRNANLDQEVRDLYQVPTLGGAERKLLHDIDTAVAFSPDGRQFVYQRGAQRARMIEVRIANADGTSDHVLTTLPEGEIPMGCAWSPDGRSIAVSWFRFGRTTNFRLDAIPIDNPSLIPLFSSPNTIGRPRWLPDGSMLLFILQDSSRHGQIWTVSYPSGEARRLTNDATNYDLSFDLTPDAHFLAAMAVSLESNLEVAPSSNPSRTRELFASDLPVLNVLPLHDGRIVTLRGGQRELWITNADGSAPRSLGVHDLVWPASCGPYLIFVSRSNVTRINLDGSDVKTLATGWSPVCSTDGKYVYYVEHSAPRWKIRRVPIEGGPITEIADNPGEAVFGLLSISPDGKSLAIPFDVYTPKPVMQIAVVSVAGNLPLRILRPAGNLDAGPRWSRDGNSLQYLVDSDGAANLWDQPLTGTARPLTRFTTGKIFDFQWSPDGQQLYLCRGHASADAILIQSQAEMLGLRAALE